MRSRVRRLGQAVGLWLAEGDKNTREEITFTNNQPYLITFFHRVIEENLHLLNTPRIAVYLPSADTPHFRPVESARYRVYIDERANLPYYIYRVSGVKATKEWRRLVSVACGHHSNYQPILQGFFAGEGNVKTGLHHSRAVRVAQGKPNHLLETMMRHFGISFTYGGHREYSITGRDNLARILALGLTELHRLKHERFQRMMSSYLQSHFSNHVLSKLVYSQLVFPQTTEELASKFKRSTSRLRQVLADLKSAVHIKTFHVNSTCYWVRTDSNVVVISKQKMKILQLLAKVHRVFELAAELMKDEKCISRRLKELERLGLARQKKPNWYRIPAPGKVVER